MAKFIVEKGKDAFIRYQTLVEADDAEAANAIAGAEEYAGAWVECGVSVFDDEQILPEDTELVADDYELEDDIAIIEVTEMERDTILAALRLWQDQKRFGPDAHINEELIEIATNGGAHEELSIDAIDALCEAINV